MDGLREDVLLFLLLFGILRTALSNLNCQINSTSQQLQLQCFHEQGIKMTLPDYFLGDVSTDKKKGYMNAVLSQGLDLLCSKQKQFRTALDCAINHTISCTPQEYHGYLPQPNSMSKIVDILCANETKINFECVRTKASDLFDCGDRKGKEAFGRGRVKATLENVMCKAFQFNVECQRSELRSCGCSTVQAYETITRDLLYPPSCPPLQHPHVQCDKSKPEFFLGSGASPSRFGVSANVAISSALVFTFMPFL